MNRIDQLFADHNGLKGPRTAIPASEVKKRLVRDPIDPAEATAPGREGGGPSALTVDCYQQRTGQLIIEILSKRYSEGFGIEVSLAEEDPGQSTWPID